MLDNLTPGFKRFCSLIVIGAVIGGGMYYGNKNDFWGIGKQKPQQVQQQVQQVQQVPQQETELVIGPGPGPLMQTRQVEQEAPVQSYRPPEPAYQQEPMPVQEPVHKSSPSKFKGLGKL
jgi:hypothetical protein